MTDAEDNGSAGADTSTVLYDARGRRIRHTVTNSGSLNQDRVYDFAERSLIEESNPTSVENLPLEGVIPLLSCLALVVIDNTRGLEP